MDIVTLGELLVDMFPAEIGRRLAEVTAFYPKPGGAPANVAMAAARLGAASAFIGKVGNDAFGHHLLNVVRQEGVETRGVCLDPEARTTMAIIALPDAQHAEFVFYRNPGADQRLRVDELDRELLSPCRALHFGSLSLTDEPSRSATHEAVRIARQAGALISFDVNYRPSLWPSPAEAMAQITAMIPKIDLLKVNEVELALLSSGGPQDLRGVTDVAGLAAAARTLLAAGPRLVVLTLEDGGIVPFPGVVDFVQGQAMAGGVFVTCRVHDRRIAGDLIYLKVGNGTYSTFFRPYHLWFIEAPISFAEAHLHRKVTLAPLDRPVAESMAVAKRNLMPGELLDDFGGYTFYGTIDRAASAQALNALQTGLAPGVTMVRPVSQGQIITWADVALDEASTIVELRRMQDRL